MESCDWLLGSYLSVVNGTQLIPLQCSLYRALQVLSAKRELTVSEGEKADVIGVHGILHVHRLCEIFHSCVSTSPALGSSTRGFCHWAI